MFGFGSWSFGEMPDEIENPITPEAKKALDAYIGRRQNWLFFGSIGTALTALGMVGGFVIWLQATVEKSAEAISLMKANEKYTQIIDVIDPKVQYLESKIRDIDSQARTLQSIVDLNVNEIRRIQSLSNSSANYVDELTAKVHNALESYNRFEENDTMISKLIEMQEEMASVRGEITHILQKSDQTDAKTGFSQLPRKEDK